MPTRFLPWPAELKRWLMLCRFHLYRRSLWSSYRRMLSGTDLDVCPLGEQPGLEEGISINLGAPPCPEIQAQQLHARTCRRLLLELAGGRIVGGVRAEEAPHDLGRFGRHLDGTVLGVLDDQLRGHPIEPAAFALGRELLAALVDPRIDWHNPARIRALAEIRRLFVAFLIDDEPPDVHPVEGYAVAGGGRTQRTMFRQRLPQREVSPLAVQAALVLAVESGSLSEMDTLERWCAARNGSLSTTLEQLSAAVGCAPRELAALGLGLGIALWDEGPGPLRMNQRSPGQAWLLLNEALYCLTGREPGRGPDQEEDPRWDATMFLKSWRSGAWWEAWYTDVLRKLSPTAAERLSGGLAQARQTLQRRWRRIARLPRWLGVLERDPAPAVEDFLDDALAVWWESARSLGWSEEDFERDDLLFLRQRFLDDAGLDLPEFDALYERYRSSRYPRKREIQNRIQHTRSRTRERLRDPDAELWKVVRWLVMGRQLREHSSDGLEGHRV